jgi:hypothetical protein
MVLQMNMAAYTQTEFDSATPSGLAVVVHPVPDPGTYTVEVQRSNALVRTRSVDVVQEPSAGAAGAGRQRVRGMQFVGDEVKVSAAGAVAPADAVQRFALQPGGVMSFSAPAGTVETPELVSTSAGGKRKRVWSATQLQPGDVYVVHLVTPGRYEVTSTAASKPGSIDVPVPKVGRGPGKPGAPLKVTCTDSAIDPDEVTANPLQQIHFQVAAPTRIRISLVERADQTT